MRVIVTRPQREAQRWVLDLSTLGLDALALPLIEVGPVAEPADLVRVWQQLADYVGVMFVSGNAVDHFFASKPPLAPEFIAQAAIKTRAWATGPGTARALLRAGVAPDRLDVPSLDAGQFDSEALWQVVGAQVQPGDRVLIVRGCDRSGSTPAGQGVGREWFANRLRQAGAQAEFVVAYQRCAPEFSAAGGQRWLGLAVQQHGGGGQPERLATRAKLGCRARAGDPPAHCPGRAKSRVWCGLSVSPHAARRRGCAARDGTDRRLSARPALSPTL
jgi:uroporphyrinogen-III synthase